MMKKRWRYPDVARKPCLCDDALPAVSKELVKCVWCNMLLMRRVLTVDVCKRQWNTKTKLAARFQNTMHFFHECFHIFQMLNDCHRKNKVNRIVMKWIRIGIKVKRQVFLDIGTIIDIDKTFAIIFSRTEVKLQFSVRQFDRNRLYHIFRQKAVIYKD